MSAFVESLHAEPCDHRVNTCALVCFTPPSKPHLKPASPNYSPENAPHPNWTLFQTEAHLSWEVKLPPFRARPMSPRSSLRPSRSLAAAWVFVALLFLSLSGCAWYFSPPSSQTDSDQQAAESTLEQSSAESTDPALSEEPEASKQTPPANLLCRPDGSPCRIQSECCEGHCGRISSMETYCKPPGAPLSCLPEGHSCTSHFNCCSNTCILDPRLGRVCKQSGASVTCVPRSRACTVDHECCSGTCVADPHLGRICK